MANLGALTNVPVLTCCAIIFLGWLLNYGFACFATAGIAMTIYFYFNKQKYISEDSLHRRKETFVVIVGAGYSGICAAIKLKQERVRFIIFEAAPELGGTWLHNVYPGCACDVPAHLYSFSFYPNPNWNTEYASQPEILQYLKEACDFYDIRKYMRFNTAVQKCKFDEKMQKWKVVTSTNEKFFCNFLISGIGLLHVPKYTEIKGCELFKGESFHTAKWKEDCSLEGKSVAIIGTGASTVQIVPSIADKVKSLYVFQRTPPWVLSNLGAAFFPDTYPKAVKYIFRQFPVILKFYRWYTFVKLELLFYTIFRGQSFLTKKIRSTTVKSMQDQLDNDSLKEKMIPRYELGCKRVTPSNKYLPAFNKTNVHLVTEPITNLTEHAIKTDKNEYQIDVLVYATGFDVTASITNLNVIGSDGVSINERWGDKPNAYLGIMYPGYPNLFYLLGPNTALGM